LAQQVTYETASLEIEAIAEEGEVEFLAQRLHESQPNQASIDTYLSELNQNIFPGGKYSRKLVIRKPTLGWNQQSNRYIQEYINGTEYSLANASVSSLISPNAFHVLAREIVLRFDQLENLNLSYSLSRSAGFSIQNIFQPTGENPGQRISRTTVSASPLLDSLIEYGLSNEEKLDELIEDYNEILDPIVISKGASINGLTNLVLDRGNGNKYTVDSASSGQKKAIALATLKKVWNQAKFKPIVLLDEPENSMHPGLTSRVFKSLNELAQSDIEPSFVIATHSPEVVAANAANTFRIVTNAGTSTLVKISGLEERASIIDELGVHFHLDYVAQKIVFVESEATGSNGGLNDAEAYQELIDPAKEMYFFVSSGSKTQARSRRAFQDVLLDKLKVSSSDITMELTDRDDQDYDVDKNTPYRNVEYLYTADKQLLSEVMSEVLDRTIAVSDLDSHIPNDVELENVDTKPYWESIIRAYRIQKEVIRIIQTTILKRLRNDPNNQTQAIKTLVERFSQS